MITRAVLTATTRVIRSHYRRTLKLLAYICQAGLDDSTDASAK